MYLNIYTSVSRKASVIRGTPKMHTKNILIHSTPYYLGDSKFLSVPMVAQN